MAAGQVKSVGGRLASGEWQAELLTDSMRGLGACPPEAARGNGLEKEKGCF